MSQVLLLTSGWRLALWCALFLCLSLGCEGRLTSPKEPQQNRLCNPWTYAGTNTLFGPNGLKDEVAGCLVIAQGNTIQRRLAQLQRSGELWGWDGQQFSAGTAIQLDAFGRTTDAGLQLWFYSPGGPALDIPALEQLCESFRPDSYRTCLTDNPVTCRFALAFRPIASPGLSLADLPDPLTTEKVRSIKAPACRLFFLANIRPTFTFATDSPAACGCKQDQLFTADGAVPLPDAAQALVMEHTGAQLLIASGKTLSLWTRKDGAFVKSAISLALSQEIWQLELSPGEEHLAIVMDSRVEVWDFQKLISGQKEPFVFGVDGEEGRKAAAVSFRKGTEPMIAIAWYRGMKDDKISLWSWQVFSTPQKVLDITQGAVQSLAFDHKGAFLLAGGRRLESTLNPAAEFTVYVLKGLGQQTTIGEENVFFTSHTNTTITTLAISPDNRFLALGTGPDLTTMRNLKGAPIRSESGHVEIWQTTPLASGGLLVKPESTRAHQGYISRLQFSDDGNILASLGLANDLTRSTLHLWYKTEKFPFFEFRQQLSTPGVVRDFVFGPQCAALFALPQEPPYGPIWSGCQ